MLKALIRARLGGLFTSMFGRFAGGARKRGPVFKVLITLLALYVIGSLFFAVGAYYLLMVNTLHDMGLDWLYFALGGLMAVTLNIVGSIFITQSQLFSARDNERLLSMPIPPGYILMSRMLTLLALNYVYTALILIPGLIVWIWRVGMSAGALIAFILGGLALPFLSLAVSSACGWVIGLVTARLRRKNLMTFVLFIAFMGGYLYLTLNMQAYMNRLLERGAAIADAVRAAMPPAFWFGQAATGDFLSLLWLILCCAVPFGLVYALISHSYVRILTMKKGAARVKYTARSMKVRGAFTALVRRELGRFLGTPIYIFNAGLGAVMHLVFAGALIVKGEGILRSLLSMPMDGMDAMIPAMAAMILCFCSVMVNPASASVSLEGKNLWIVKSAPLSTLQILHAKLATNLLAALPTGLIAGVVGAAVLPGDGLSKAALVLLPAAAGTFAALLGLSANLLWPRLDWISEAVVVKQSASVMVSVFGGMAVLALPVILYMAWLNAIIAPGVYMLGALVFMAALCAGLYGFVRTGGVRRFEMLG